MFSLRGWRGMLCVWDISRPPCTDVKAVKPWQKIVLRIFPIWSQWQPELSTFFVALHLELWEWENTANILNINSTLFYRALGNKCILYFVYDCLQNLDSSLMHEMINMFSNSVCCSLCLLSNAQPSHLSFFSCLKSKMLMKPLDSSLKTTKDMDIVSLLIRPKTHGYPVVSNYSWCLSIYSTRYMLRKTDISEFVGERLRNLESSIKPIVLNSMRIW